MACGTTGKNEVTVSRWCRNVQQPDLETLYRVAELLDVKVIKLLVEDGMEKKMTRSDEA